MKSLFILLTSVMAGTTLGLAAPEAKVTKIHKAVKVMYPNQEPQKAALDQQIAGRTGLQTGRRSRAELTHPDKMITRLGQNTHFNFLDGARDMELHKGALLLRVPKGTGGAKIRCATVTAGISGTTLMLEYHQDGWVKLITLEGTVNLTLKAEGRAVDVPAGTMLIVRADGTVLQKPVGVDLKRLVKTAALLDEKYFDPLPEETDRRIQTTMDDQQELINIGEYIRKGREQHPPGLKDTVRAYEGQGAVVLEGADIAP